MLKIESSSPNRYYEFYSGRLRLPPGAGKTAIVLELLKQEPAMKRARKTDYSSNYATTHTTRRHEPPLLPINLIIVPHSLFFQWKYEIERIANMKFIFMNKCQQLPKLNKSSPPINILIKNTILAKFVALNSLGEDFAPNVTLMRVFVDEYDSIRKLAHVPLSRFVWLVSATSARSRSRHTFISRNDNDRDGNLVTFSDWRISREQEQLRVKPQEPRVFKHYYRAHVLCKVLEGELGFEEILQLNAGDTSLDPRVLVNRIRERMEDKVTNAIRALESYEGESEERVVVLAQRVFLRF
jgi:hypothetical protein